MDDELHAAGVVEEPLEHQALLGGHDAERGPAHGQVVDDHRRGVGADAGGVGQPPAGAVGVAGGEKLVDPDAQLGHLVRELGGAGRRLAQPERDGGRRVAGVAHAHHPGLDPADLPRVGAEQEDVAGHRLDGPVLVDRADEGVVGLGHHPVVAGLGDGAARGGRRQPGACAGPAARR